MTGPQIPRYKSAEDCPRVERHTACPTGYLAWHEWARKMSQSYRQRKCPTCGFYAVWVLKSGEHSDGPEGGS